MIKKEKKKKRSFITHKIKMQLLKIEFLLSQTSLLYTSHFTVHHHIILKPHHLKHPFQPPFYQIQKLFFLYSRIGMEISESLPITLRIICTQYLSYLAKNYHSSACEHIGVNIQQYLVFLLVQKRNSCYYTVVKVYSNKPTAIIA